jgi:hypothetical protein
MRRDFFTHRVTHKFILSCVLIIPLLSSCQQNTSKAPQKLFDFDSLLHVQTQALVETKATLHKTVSIQGKADSVILQDLDSQRWASELEIFHQLSQINKPINRNTYSITEQDDSQSNLRVHTFHSESNIPFADVKIYYLKTSSNIRKIEGFVDERNALYQSTRTLKLNFREIHNKLMLTSYSIKGGQHMMLDDTVQFHIQGFITIH